ncbi:MAG: N-acetylglucosaminyl-diphospho-decaprenol L-rhamnosyltransferase [Flavobacteriales bacterium]|jgi:N-acetylglucosaminyl-diphospho-decaprenol L-rhamnosyltransferase
MNQLNLAVVIINYGTLELTKACVESVLPQLGDNNKIVIVDNNSPDQSGLDIRTWLEEQNITERCSLVLSDENTGFSGGNNLGIKALDAKNYLLLNSDAIVRENAIAHMLDALRSEDQSVGLATPRLEWEDARPQISCFRFHNPISEFIRAISTNIITRALGAFDVPIDVKDDDSYCEWSSFACIMIKREVLDDVGLMDEGYFLYYEDADYCREAHNMGWRTINTPSAHVIHLRGGSSETKENIIEKKRLPLYVHASRTRYFYKHYGFFGLLIANLMWTVGAVVSEAKRIVFNKPSPICQGQFKDIWFRFTKPGEKYRPF